MNVVVREVVVKEMACRRCEDESKQVGTNQLLPKVHVTPFGGCYHLHECKVIEGAIRNNSIKDYRPCSVCLGQWGKTSTDNLY